MKKWIALALSLLLLFSVASADLLVGGWSPVTGEEAALTEETQAVFDSALEGLLGVSYTPVLLLAKQVVSGTNYCFLCEATAVVPDAVTTWCLVYVYEALDGSVELLNIADLDVAEFADYAGE